MSQRLIRQFDEIGLDDVGLVGGKNASLGELQRALGGRSMSPPALPLLPMRTVCCCAKTGWNLNLRAFWMA